VALVVLGATPQNDGLETLNGRNDVTSFLTEGSWSYRSGRRKLSRQLYLSAMQFQ
jgi:hypothetical protein